ncbi:hypothetical protein [Hyphomonas sp.]|uniref:hypothetical protein n=1 Tax=Hyphomonas sp. TaxID=87 RepID=UPI000C8B03E1|nr:hypothetical protein [Hyphomonas sp.]MAL46996.1 hypothetical protein [Hyphomonas sp.]
MGIGYALASGLVQGFTQNIGREMERRAGEKEKLEAYRMLIANAAVTGGEDFSATNAKLIGDMVSKADARYKEQGGIDIFGTKGDSIFGDEEEEFNTLLNSFTGGKTAVASLPITSTFDLVDYMSPDLVDRLEKDRSNPQKLGTIVMQGLDQAVKNLGEDQFSALFPTEKDINDLAGFFTFHRNAYLTPDVSKPGATRGFPDNVEMQLGGITNYDFFDKLLGLSQAAGRNKTYNSLKQIASDGSMYVPGEERAPDEFTVISGTVRGGSSKPENAIIFPVGAFTENDIDVDILGRVAESQGRTFDDYVFHASQNFGEGQAAVIAGFKHISNIAKGMFVGGKMDFDSVDNLVFLGNYLDKNIENPSQQVRLINAVQGTVLTSSERFAVDSGFHSIDEYKQGTDRESGYKLTFGEGSTFSQFKERVAAARRASARLKDYYDIVSKIRTPADTALDTLAMFVNSIFDKGGKVDQIVDMIIGDTQSYDGERDEITSAVEYIFNEGKKGTGDELERNGLRAKRDSLAFIIAADMARAEDPSGRLSDGDLQRNLQKLTGRGFRTKIGEIKALKQVRDSFVEQVNMLAGIESRVEIGGARGFSVEMQDEILALKTRDLALAQFYIQEPLQSLKEALEPTLTGPLTGAEIIKLSTGESPKYYADPQLTSAAGTVYAVLGDFDQVYIVSPDPTDPTKGTIVQQGTKQQLQNEGAIQFVPIGQTPAAPAASNNAAPAAPDNNTQTVQPAPDNNQQVDVDRQAYRPAAGSGPAAGAQSTYTSRTGNVVLPDGSSGTATVTTRPGSLGDGTVLTINDLLVRGIDPSKDRKVLPPSQGGGYTFTGIDGVYDIQQKPQGHVYVKRPDANAGTQGAN